MLNYADKIGRPEGLIFKYFEGPKCHKELAQWLADMKEPHSRLIIMTSLFCGAARVQTLRVWVKRVPEHTS
jgi:hypothetical protein